MRLKCMIHYMVSSHQVFKIHIIKLTCENFIKIGAHIFKKTMNNGFCFISDFVHVHIELISMLHFEISCCIFGLQIQFSRR